MCIMYFYNSVIHLVILLSILLYPLSGPTWSMQHQSGTHTWQKIRIYLQALRSLHVIWWPKTGTKATMSFCIWQTYPLLQTTLNCVPCTKLCTTWLYTLHQILLYLKSLDCILAHLLPFTSPWHILFSLKSFVPHAVSHWNSLPEPLFQLPPLQLLNTHLQCIICTN